ncbi:BRD4-interacting chromatin-remodeling complex-associated protein [Pantherophis guttatus]|uniref:BRD4-interacting chromatin-remodeling complex-associated protein n=1 Tax=Pantherophis guttatus TaxID=94885 RepID=A0A6P9DNQ1_PANGU|nr:BRD4-interacting chromatin-remodeling complex-associated protein [Pantherophis guttatus]XP_034293976.1 BRD4-interacting chromatin-remodeling complex-associated protein [Pantherophis guttatus]XP_034293977.1 BRD4-interacting chromatin-remodeling complex-associated protein [Pantherophis guttatus]XP_034293978.1 BRD4-interacting chromatin-remodeling complex-associated protein [Pantherophis guttatus]XP_060549804.1 BRD4-interacting chromatin-remodeling complex-associated protein [Pantherophis gutta
MDDEDGRCLLDVICDPQALNDFLHGSEKIDSDDLLDNTGDAASAFFEGAGLHVQETSGNHLNAEQSQPTTSVDLDFLEDDILGSPSGGGANLQNSDQPCDILQQSLQEANITEQTLEAEAELDLGSFQLPTLQPVVHTASDGTPQIFSGGADLIGLQQPAVLTHQALVQQSVGADVVNKAISVQPFLQQVGLGNVTIQPISNLQGLPNGSPSGALGIGQIQVVGQQVMAINQPAQQIIAKQVQPSQVATMPVGSYITQTAPEQQQVTLASAGVSPQNAGLVIQKNLPAVATTTLNGSSMFGSVSAAQGSQPLTVTSNLSSPLVQAQNVIIHRTPTPIQPKPAGVLQQKLYQITPKPFGPNNTTLTLQNEAALQQQKAQQNLTFMAGKAGQNVVLSGFPPGLPANMFKQPPPQQQTLNKPMSVHLLNQGSSIVIPAQHVPQAMLQGQNQFLLPGQLTGTSTVQIPQQLSALQANMGGQILTTSHPSGQTHIITSQGPGGQLITNQALPAQILTNQNLASQLNLGQVLTSQNAHGTAHILSAPIQLQPGQVGQPTLFQMPVSLAGSLTTQSQPTAAASLTGGAINQSGQTVIQGVTLPNQVAMLNAAESLNQTVTIQAPPNATSQSPGLIQPQSASSTNLLPSDQANMLTVQSASQPSAPSQLQLNVQQQTPPPQQQAQIPVTSQSSPNLVASSPEKIILGQTAAGTVISQDSMQMFLQQKDQSQQQQQQQQQQQFYSSALKMQQESSMNDSAVPPHLPMSLPIYSLATTALSTTSSVPASVIVSSSVGTALQPPASRELNQSHNLPPVDSKVPQFSTGPSQQALACQLPSGQQKLPGASPSHSLPHPSMGENPQLQPTHLSQIQSPHQSRPPSQPQPLSRPPSRPHSRPPSQPQTLSRPPSEPLSRSCTPQTQMQNLYVIQNQIASSPHGSNQHPLRPPSQPQVSPFQAPQAQPEGQPQLATPPHLSLQVQLAPQLQPQSEAQARLQPQIQASSEVQHTHSPHFQLQFPAQGPIKPPTPTQTLHLTAEQQRSFQMVSNQFQALSTIPVPVPQQKQLMDRFQQVPQGIILQTKQSTSTSQAPPALSQFSNQSSSVLVSSQGQQLTMTTIPAQAPAVHGHTPVPTTIQSSSTGSGKAAPVLEKGQVPRGTTSGGGGQQPAQCTAVLQQQTPVLVKSASVSIAATVPTENKTFSSSSTIISGGKATSGQGKATIPHAVQQSVQAKPGVISSASGLNLGKGQLPLQVVGKGLSQVMSSAPAQIQQQYDNKLGSLKKAPPMLQPSKEACFLEQLHKHQGAVLHPDYKTSFRSFEDAFQRLLPYHVYQGTLPSPHDYRKDEEFEMVSTQLLKRTQAMLNKYRLLLLEESRRVSPSAEMVMIDRMFIQEEKTTLALDKQLAKEKPDEYVSSSSRSQSFASSSSAQGSLPSHVPLTSENLKSPPVQMPTHINPTKLVIKHSGGSPSVTWAKASPSLDGDDDALPSRSRPPIKTYEARSRIGLKLKIKQEAGLSKVVHNTALDPVHQTPPPVCTVIKTADQHSSTSSVSTTTATTATATASMAGQMNGTIDHIGAAPVEKKPMATYCRLPLRKTYRENVDAFVAEKAPDASLKGSVSKSDTVPSTLIIKQDGGSRSVITSHKSQESPSGAVAEKSRSEENTKHTFFNRSDARSLVMQGSPAPPKTDDSTSGLMKELAEVEDEFYQRMIKTEPLDHGSASELAWEVPLPPAKRRKSESFDVDNASFSSDSPPDDSLNEHLQSAIDSILNLQQPQAGSQNTRTPSSSYNSSSSPFSSPVHRTDTYLAPNHNGGLGTRTLNR